MPRAAGEGRRVALVAGEPGVGQEPPGARVRRGRAAERGPRPLRRLRRGRCDARTGRSSRRSTSSCACVDAAELRAALGAGGGELTRLLPDLPALVGGLPAPVAADPDTERHRLHIAVADLLAAVEPRAADPARARGRPLGRRADAAAAAPPRPRRLERAAALLVTFRDTEADLPPALVGDARRPAALRGRRADAARRRSRAPRSPSSSAAPPAWRRSPTPELRELADGDPRPHRRQRVPRLRAVAGARRDRRGRGRRRAGRG